jgi:hypothetical protein
MRKWGNINRIKIGVRSLELCLHGWVDLSVSCEKSKLLVGGRIASSAKDKKNNQ